MFRVTVLLFEVSNEFKMSLNGFSLALARTYSDGHYKSDILRERKKQVKIAHI